ncbi:MAG: DNA-binding response regulator [Legionellales bacterium RIFCSPHIGHO2_12_FULL_37_14]|nr:MAG: DNA-binding response regulator [Legionellales bacterium RIFCSPHIGHO2_12_FULL_37_14]
MRILIIEDNQTTASYLIKGLKEHYFIPDLAKDGKEGLYLLNNYTYDIIILDIMLPYIDGWKLLEKINEANISTPILCLTAKDTVEDRVKGLELGADDYLVKPFAFTELLARLKNIAKRSHRVTADILTIADLNVDPQKHQVTRNGTKIHLSAKEFMLLLLFLRRQGDVLSRTFIAEQVWDINFDSDTNVIDVAVKRLRDKIDKNFSLKLIHAIRGVGYVLEKR